MNLVKIYANKRTIIWSAENYRSTLMNLNFIRWYYYDMIIINMIQRLAQGNANDSWNIFNYVPYTEDSSEQSKSDKFYDDIMIKFSFAVAACFLCGSCMTGSINTIRICICPV